MVMEELIINVENMEVTDRIGRRLGRVLTVGHVIGLIGPLGSGKTTLVKSIAAGAEVKDLRQVNSPTFVIVNEYETHPLGEKNRSEFITWILIACGAEVIWRLWDLMNCVPRGR